MLTVWSADSQVESTESPPTLDVQAPSGAARPNFKSFRKELAIMQALNALLFPIAAPDESTAQLTQQNFVASGCISALLQAVRTADSNDSTGQPVLYLEGHILLHKGVL